MTVRSTWLLLVIGLVLGTGCRPSSEVDSAPANAGAAFRLAQEPAGATGVKQLKEKAADGDEVVLEGRIGGDADPWVKGQAAFLVVDPALKPCNEQEDDACATPWDYCCDLDQLAASKALVKLVDSQGKLVRTDARQLLGLKELQTVVIHGKAQRDDAGNLTVLADGVFVRK